MDEKKPNQVNTQKIIKNPSEILTLKRVRQKDNKKIIRKRMIKKIIILILIILLAILTSFFPGETISFFAKFNIPYLNFPYKISYYVNNNITTIPKKLYLFSEEDKEEEEEELWLMSNIYNTSNYTKTIINPLYDNYQLVSHRGGIGAPDNTIVAFENAIKKGYKILECDITFTKDSIPIVFHDVEIQLQKDGKKRPIDSYLFEELSNYDFSICFPQYPKYKNEKIPTLKEFFLLIKKYGVLGEIDLTKIHHSKKNLRIIYSLVTELDLKGSVIFTGDYNTLSSLNKDIIVSISYIFDLSVMQKLEGFARTFTRATFSCDHKWITDEMIRFSFERGIPIKAWTLEDKNKTIILFKKGIKHILSDSILPFDYPKPFINDFSKIYFNCETKRSKTKCLIDKQSQWLLKKNKEYQIFLRDGKKYKKIFYKNDKTIKYLYGREENNITTPFKFFNETSGIEFLMNQKIQNGKLLKGQIIPKKKIIPESFILDIYCIGGGSKFIKCYLDKNTGKIKTGLEYVLKNLDNYY